MVNLFAPKKGKQDEFWDQYQDEIAEYDKGFADDDDYNDGDWEEAYEEDY